jgi:hypothetical protein
VGSGSIGSKRIRFRIVLVCDTRVPAILNAVELRANEVNEVLYDVHFDFSLSDQQVLLNGAQATERAEDVLAILDTWKELAVPLTLRYAGPGGGATLFDNIKGQIDPVSFVVLEWDSNETKLAGNVVFKKV